MESRRSFLNTIGGVALAHLFASESRADGLHHPAKVKRVVQLFMNGGVSQMDTFDYKPELVKHHGTTHDFGIKSSATGSVGPLMKSPFGFKQYGECGKWVSDVFPHMAKCVDDMAFLMSMASKSNVHGPASYMQNTGFILPGFPCFGAWVSYALGRLTDNLPTFVVLPDARGLPYNQTGNFSAGFLPASHQGTVINPSAPSPIPDLHPPKSAAYITDASSNDGMTLLDKMNRKYQSERPGDSRLDARVASYELAAKMQLHAPEAFDLSRETQRVRQWYGLDVPATDTGFARNCLVARRLIERGVRFVQVWSGAGGPSNNWDNHGNIPTELPAIAKQVDRPCAALLQDLKSRGLLDDTLVIWTTEFGRMPFTQNSVGRDHNGGTFVTWLAGAGVQGGISHGASDDFAYQTAERKTYCYDLHATVLHLMGIDHEKLTVRNNGSDRRLTDVHGEVIEDILK